jgi:hypothetical protein
MSGDVQAHLGTGQRESGNPVLGFSFFAASDHRANIKVRLRPISFASCVSFTPYFLFNEYLVLTG